MADRPLQILLLTREDCAFCHDAEAIVERLAREFHLSAERMDLDTVDGLAMAERGGIVFPPGIFVDGEPVCYGRPSERKLRRFLEHQLRVG